ncbi:hypothetical protein LUZ60_008425 [Juncus effusus]|nr:hypothetical protein LUZ60_008425 [Juncus effusus]
METKLERNLNPLTLPPSPNSSTSSSTSSTNNGSGNLPANPLTPRPNNNSVVPRTIETTPYPTTFVQADSSSFKQVVQMLTGSTSANSGSTKAAPITSRSAATGPKKPSFKLYERRGSLKNLKSISPLIPTAPSFFSPRSDVLSPSILDFPSLVLSPVTPLSPSLASPADTVNNSTVVEERVIQEKGFFLHPSPRGSEPPRLLPLFPVTSPRVSSE